MPTFQYTAYTAAGGIETGQVEAQSGEAALGLLAARGLTPFETKPARPSKSSSILQARHGSTLEDIAHLTRELATLLEAELPVDEALRLLTGQTTNARTQVLVQRLLAAVTEGSSLSAALHKEGAGVPTVVTSLVRAGEARGTLGPTLTEIARLLEGQVEVRARIRSALVYPLVLAGIAVVTLGIVLTVLFPSLLQLFEDSRVEPPFILALARDASRLFADYWAVILPALIAMLVLAGVGLRRAAAAGTIDRLMLRLPVIGGLRRKIAVAALTRTLGSLIRNGLQLVEALSITAAVVPSVALANSLRVATDALKEGHRLSQALAADGALPSTVTRLITIGEETSRLDTMLLHVADMYDRDAARHLERAMTLLSPLVTVAVGLLVGGIILSVMQAVLSINTLAMR